MGILYKLFIVGFIIKADIIIVQIHYGPRFDIKNFLKSTADIRAKSHNNERMSSEKWVQFDVLIFFFLEITKVSNREKFKWYECPGNNVKNNDRKNVTTALYTIPSSYT